MSDISTLYLLLAIICVYCAGSSVYITAKLKQEILSHKIQIDLLIERERERDAAKRDGVGRGY